MSDAARMLLKQFPPNNDQLTKQELEIILNELSMIISNNVEGAVLEFGCYKGATSLYISRLLDLLSPARPFHAYDSFAGLPEKQPFDDSPAGSQFKAGELMASRSDIVTAHKKAGLRPPAIHKGWFEGLTAEDVPEKVAFAFLDGDYYSSIKTPLVLIQNRLAAGAVIIIDDYHNEALPGVQKAVDEWAGPRGLSMTVTHSLAILHP